MPDTANTRDAFFSADENGFLLIGVFFIPASHFIERATAPRADFVLVQHTVPKAGAGDITAFICHLDHMLAYSILALY